MQCLELASEMLTAIWQGSPSRGANGHVPLVGGQESARRRSVTFQSDDTRRQTVSASIALAVFQPIMVCET